MSACQNDGVQAVVVEKGCQDFPDLSDIRCHPAQFSFGNLNQVGTAHTHHLAVSGKVVD